MKETVECIIKSNTSWVEIVNIVIASVNVCAVILFFVFEKRRQKKDKLNEYNLSWYKMINIPDRTRELDEIVKEAINNLEKLRNNKEIDLNKRKKESEKLIISFAKKTIEEKNIITPIMKCIDENSNKTISKKINDLREMHDSIFINEAVLNNNSIDYSKFIDLKNSIIDTYYNVGKNFLK